MWWILCFLAWKSLPRSELFCLCRAVARGCWTDLRCSLIGRSRTDGPPAWPRFYASFLMPPGEPLCLVVDLSSLSRLSPLLLWLIFLLIAIAPLSHAGPRSSGVDVPFLASRVPPVAAVTILFVRTSLSSLHPAMCCIASGSWPFGGKEESAHQPPATAGARREHGRRWRSPFACAATAAASPLHAAYHGHRIFAQFAFEVGQADGLPEAGDAERRRETQSDAGTDQEPSTARWVRHFVAEPTQQGRWGVEIPSNGPLPCSTSAPLHTVRGELALTPCLGTHDILPLFID